jgi:hypothetical protein
VARDPSRRETPYNLGVIAAAKFNLSMAALWFRRAGRICATESMRRIAPACHGDPHGPLAHKNPAVQRILDAFEAHLARLARPAAQ